MPIRVNIGKEHATVGGVGGTATSQTNSATMDLTKKKLVTAKAGGVADVAAVTDNQGAGVRQSKRAAKPKKRDDK